MGCVDGRVEGGKANLQVGTESSEIRRAWEMGNVLY